MGGVITSSLGMPPSHKHTCFREPDLELDWALLDGTDCFLSYLYIIPKALDILIAQYTYNNVY